jgi:hypothetical protein
VRAVLKIDDGGDRRSKQRTMDYQAVGRKVLAAGHRDMQHIASAHLNSVYLLRDEKNPTFLKAPGGCIYIYVAKSAPVKIETISTTSYLNTVGENKSVKKLCSDNNKN